MTRDARDAEYRERLVHMSQWLRKQGDEVRAQGVELALSYWDDMQKLVER